MGKVNDLLMSGSSDKELNAMINNARDQHNKGYVQFLEEQLEKAEQLIDKIKDMTKNRTKVSVKKSILRTLVNRYNNDKK